MNAIEHFCTFCLNPLTLGLVPGVNFFFSSRTFWPCSFSLQAFDKLDTKHAGTIDREAAIKARFRVRMSKFCPNSKFQIPNPNFHLCVFRSSFHVFSFVISQYYQEVCTRGQSPLIFLDPVCRFCLTFISLVPCPCGPVLLCSRRAERAGLDDLGRFH